MRPGDRRQRWETASSIEAMMFIFFSIIVFSGVDGTAGYVIGGVLAVMALLAIRDRQRGWKMRYDLPPWGRDAIARGDPIAIAAWEDTKRDARRKNRKRYAFDED
ncbi:MAG: hypothetical protein V3W44_08725 [Dehalococcoidales bacterium]